MNRQEQERDEAQQPYANSSKSQELVRMKSKVEKEVQAKTEAETEIGATQEESTGGSGIQAEKEKVDARSIYVGNVDYFCTPEEVQQHFSLCGTVNRVTILIDSYGHPKGYAYVEFVEKEAVQNALLLNETELCGRQLRVSAKRTNVPGMSQFRGGRPTPQFGFRYPAYSPYGQFPRARRYRPY